MDWDVKTIHFSSKDVLENLVCARISPTLINEVNFPVDTVLMKHEFFQNPPPTPLIVKWSAPVDFFFHR